MSDGEKKDGQYRIEFHGMGVAMVISGPDPEWIDGKIKEVIEYGKQAKLMKFGGATEPLPINDPEHRNGA